MPSMGDSTLGHVLVAEDDRSVRESLVLALALEGYDVEAVTDGEQALAAVDRTSARRRRARRHDAGRRRPHRVPPPARPAVTPILMLTARHEVSDRVAGLDAGADDYLVKPFALDELLAAAARAAAPHRASRAATTTLQRRRPRARPARRDAPSAAAAPLDLTKTEFDLLELLMVNAGIVLSRDTIYERIWGFDFETSSRSLDVYIGYLRRKTEAEGEPRLVHTVRGVGLRAPRRHEPPLAHRARPRPSSPRSSARSARPAAYLTTTQRLENSVDESLLARGAGDGERRPRALRRRPDDRDQAASVSERLPAARRVCSPRRPRSSSPPTARSRRASHGGPSCSSAVDRRRRRRQRLRTVTIDGTHYRVLTSPWHRRRRAPDRPQPRRDRRRARRTAAPALRSLALGGTVAAAALGWRVRAPASCVRSMRLRDTAEQHRQHAGPRDADPGRRRGEVGSLARSFTTMVDALATSRRAAAAARHRREPRAAHAAHEPAHQRRAARPGRRARPDEQRSEVVDGVQLEVDELTDLVSELVELATDRSADRAAPKPVRAGRPRRRRRDTRARAATGREVDGRRRRTDRNVFVGQPHSSSARSRTWSTTR